MPLYQYKCLKCQTEEEEFVFKWDEEVLCEGCQSPKERQFPTHMGPIGFGWPEGGITLEHAESQPIHLKTRKQAKQYERKHNVQLGCL
jgi:putative FmdB family regulatory protein